jgi:hypothetical protein
VGTIANARGCEYTELGSLVANSSRPAEIWFLRINKGDTPETNESAKIAAEWVREWIDHMRATFAAPVMTA